MTVLFNWLASDGGRALLLALAHSIWVGGLAWTALALLFRRLSARRCEMRYGLALGAQGLVFGLTLFLWSWFAHVAGEARVGPASSGPGAAVAIGSAATKEVADEETYQTAPTLAGATGHSLEAFRGRKSGPIPQAELPSTVDADSRPVAHWPQWWGMAWLVGAVAVLGVRLWRFGHTWRLSARCPVITDGPWQALLEEERLRMAYGRAVALRVVDGLASPAAWGFFRPVILIPASMVTGLSTETMRMILAHELSHLRRWDPLVQALQCVVEAIFFFNPFVWLLSRQIALERESCCDAVAADRTDAPTYAEALLAVGRQAGWSGHDVATPAVLGDSKPSSLAARIGRLLRPADCPSPRLSLRLLLLALVVALVAVFVGRQASDAAVAVLTHQEWIQEIQADLDEERREQGSNWKEGDQMVLTGRVTNQAGEALPDASVRLIAHYANGAGVHGFSVQVDAEGYYRRELRLTDYSPAKRPYASLSVTVAAPGHEVERLRVSTVKGGAEQDFTLEPGLSVELECVNEAGAALAATDLELEYAGEGFRFDDAYRTDAEGQLRMVLPSKELLWFTIRAEGYRDWRQQRSFADDNNIMRVTLRQGAPIRGIVRDAETGEPIADAGVFLIHSLSLYNNQSHVRSFGGGQKDPLIRTNAEGVFEIYSLGEDRLHWFVIDAEGYLAGFPGAADSRKNRRLDGESALIPGDELAQVNLIPKRSLRVKILPPAGWPIEGGDIGRIHYSHAYMTGGGSHGGHSHGSRFRRQKVEIEQGVIETSIQPAMASPLRIGLNQTDGPGLTLEGWNYEEPLVVDLRDQPAQTNVEQEYIVRFDLPESAPPPRGEINVDYTGSGYGSSKIAVPLEAGIARFTIKHQFDRTPRIDATGVIGYTFEQQELPQPADGEAGPMVHTVRTLRPAGALTLSITNVKSDESMQVVVDVYKPFGTHILPFWSKMDWTTEHRIEMPAGQTEVVINPLPLGRKLRVTVRQGHTWMRENLSPVRETNPFPRQEIRMPEGEQVSGRVLDTDGQPLGGTPVTLNFMYDRTESSYTTSHFRTRADAQGFFDFDRVSFNADGIYYLRVESGSGYREYRALLKKNQREQRIRLEAPIPRTIRVEVAETGKPIEGRKLEIHEISLPGERRFMARSLYPVWPTNVKGELPIETLPPSGRFNFRVWFPTEEGGRSGFNVEREIDEDDQTIVIRVPEARLRRVHP